jgi:hypothetical protein
MWCFALEPNWRLLDGADGDLNLRWFPTMDFEFTLALLHMP